MDTDLTLDDDVRWECYFKNWGMIMNELIPLIALCLCIDFVIWRGALRNALTILGIAHTDSLISEFKTLNQHAYAKDDVHPRPCQATSVSYFRAHRAVTAYQPINLASKDHETSTADEIPARQNILFISSSDLTLHHKP